MRELAPAAAWRCDQIASPCCSFYARVVAATFPRVRSRELALFAPQPQYHPKRGWLISSDQLHIIREPLCHGVKPTGLPRFTLRAVKDACPGQADLVHATNVQSSHILAKQSGFAAVADGPTCSKGSVSRSFWAQISCSSGRLCGQYNTISWTDVRCPVKCS